MTLNVDEIIESIISEINMLYNSSDDVEDYIDVIETISDEIDNC